jgi:TRAP-type C4-dicarboxylate transport system substrate-binding protein
MSARPLLLDFAGGRSGGGIAGMAMATAGLLALAAVAVHLHSVSAQRAGLELRHAQLVRQHNSQTAPKAIAGLPAQSAAGTVRELATPWSALLAELERASQDTSGSVAVLVIEPDHAKHRVHLTAEARSLELAIAYVQRLRKVQALHFPMLDNHELVKDEHERPIRFQVSTDWSDAT